jgi:predicted RNA-binding protein with PUA-like domain
MEKASMNYWLVKSEPSVWSWDQQVAKGAKGEARTDIKADKPLKTPVTMAAIKADKKLAAMALVKYSRLSVQPVTAEEWKYVCKMGGV